MTKFVLRMFDSMSWLIQMLGADYPQFRAILETKLTLDGRRQMMGFQNHHKKESSNAFTGALFFYALTGLVVGVAILQVSSLLVSLTVVHSMVMTMMAMSLIADFSSVLLDTADNAILQPRPISGRTILLARIAHISLYLGLIGLSLSLGSIVFGMVKVNILFPIFFVGSLICSMILVICLANVFYLVTMRLTDPEKVRDIILYFQIAMSIGVFAGSQLMPRLIGTVELKNLSIENEWWVYIFPPAWMAAPIDLLFGDAGKTQYFLTLQAILIPALGLWFVVRVLAPQFNRSLAELDSESTRIKAGTRTSVRRPLVSILSPWVSKKPITRASFELVWHICTRDRQFKLRTYPMVAFMFVFPLPFIISPAGKLWYTIGELHGTKLHLLALYMSSVFLSGFLPQIRYSDKWPAAWIYKSLPIRRPGEVLVGAFWAVALRFLTPAFLLIATVLLVIWGPGIVPDIALALCVTLSIGVAQAVGFARRLPFSENFGVKERSSNVLKNIFFLFIPLGLGGLHYLLTFVPGGVILAIPFMGLITLALIRRYAATTWMALAD